MTKCHASFVPKTWLQINFFIPCQRSDRDYLVSVAEKNESLRELVRSWRADADRLEAMAETQAEDRIRLSKGKDTRAGRFELELRERVRTLRQMALDLSCALNAQDLARLKRDRNKD